MKNTKTRVILTTDGYVLAETPCGKFSDGDMTFNSINDVPCFVEYDDHCPGYDAQRAADVIYQVSKLWGAGALVSKKKNADLEQVRKHLNESGFDAQCWEFNVLHLFIPSPTGGGRILFWNENDWKRCRRIVDLYFRRYEISTTDGFNVEIELFDV